MIFNQACAGSSPAIPVNFVLAVAQRQSVALWMRRRRVRFSPADPNSLHGALGESGSSRLILDQEINGSNPLRAIDVSWNCGREVRHLLVKQADDGFESLQFRFLRAPRAIRVQQSPLKRRRRGSSPRRRINRPGKRFAGPVASHGVWCNDCIQVLGTCGDSSILSTPTIHAPLVQTAEDAALPTPRRGFDSRTVLQLFTGG